MRKNLFTGLMVLFGATSVFAGTAFDLSVELEKNPVGLDVAKPRFSWKLMPEAGKRAQIQTAYRLILGTDERQVKMGNGDVFDSGKVFGRDSILVDILTDELKPRTDYYWSVQLWDEAGDSRAFAPPAKFDTGYFTQQEWVESGGMWIESPLEIQSNDVTESWIRYALVNLEAVIDMLGYKEKVDPEDIQDYVDKKRDQLSELVWPGCLVRKEFDANKISKARLYISGLGYYRAYLNGRRIGDRDLAPSDSNFRANAYYNVYDVTDQINDYGKNCIGVELVNGRWRAWPGNTPETYHDRPVLIARLELTDTEGNTKIVVTDESWKAGEHGIVKSNFWVGEVFDANVYPEGWNQVGFNDSRWVTVREPRLSKPVGELSRDPMPPEKIVEYHEPVEVTEPMPNVYVYDFGKQIVGRSKITFRGLKKGQKVAIRYSEVMRRDLPGKVPFTLGYYPGFENKSQIPGMLHFKRRGSTALEAHIEYTGSDGKKGMLGSYSLAGMALYTDMFVSAGEAVEVFEPSFTYVGFRYFEIIGLDSKPKAGDVKAFTLRTDPVFTGTMQTGSDQLNRVLGGTQASLLGNFHSQYQDNPGAERNAGSLNEGIQVENTAYWMNAHPLWEKHLLNMSSQNDYLNKISYFHTGMRENYSVKNRFTHISATLGYGTVPLGMYAFYNDRRAVEAFAEDMMGWVTEVTEYTYWNQDHYSGSGDHIAETSLGKFTIPKGAKQREITTRPMFKAAWIVFVSGKIQNLLESMGRIDDANKVQKQIEVFNKRLLDETELYDAEKGIWESSAFLRMGVDTCVLISGLMPQRPLDVIVEEMADEIEKLGYQTSGARLTYYILQQLSQNGHEDLAASLLMREEYPSLLYLMKTTVNTIPEAWNFVHSFTQIEGLAAPGRWYYNDLVGIKALLDEPAFGRFILRPNVPSQLDSFHFTYESVRGLIESHWKETDSLVEWKIRIPPNSVAEVHVPTQEDIAVEEGMKFLRTEAGRRIYEMGSGYYCLQFPAKLKQK